MQRLWMLGMILCLTMSACGSSVLSLDVGTCFDDPPSFAEVTDVPVIPCAEPHDHEVIALLELGGSTFPGDEVVGARAEEGCVAAFEPYVGISYAESIYDVGWFAPTPDSWSIGDREVMCFAFDLTGAKTEGSISGVGR